MAFSPGVRGRVVQTRLLTPGAAGRVDRAVADRWRTHVDDVSARMRAKVRRPILLMAGLLST
ncbi:hypothetical protein GCM10027184_16390 [Saccharothrix stipae]